MIEPYTIWKTIHVSGATVILGTGAGIAFFCWFGYRRALATNDIGVLRATLALTVRADAWFTGPAVVLQFVSGFALVQRAGWSWTSAWAITVLALFVFAGACWLPVVWLQRELARESERVSSIASLSNRFHRRFRIWFALGVPAFGTVVVLVYLMVAKPLPVT